MDEIKVFTPWSPTGRFPPVSIQGDAMSLPLGDRTIDLIVTSPPFFAQRTYMDNGVPVDDQIGAETTPWIYLDRLMIATAEMVRVLKPEGSIFVNLGDKYCGYTNGQAKGRSLAGGLRGEPKTPDGPVSAPTVYGVLNKSLMGLPWRWAIRCMDDLHLILRAEIVWAKRSAVPEKVKDRAHRIHEQWFHFTKRDRYFAVKDAPAMKSVWTPSTGYGSSGHPAPYPPGWPSDIIERWCPMGGYVLDPFGGSGTTAVQASAMGRRGISLDKSREYAASV